MPYQVSHKIYSPPTTPRSFFQKLGTLARVTALVALLPMVATCRATFSELSIVESTNGTSDARPAGQ